MKEKGEKEGGIRERKKEGKGVKEGRKEEGK